MDVGNRNDWREQLVVPSADLMKRINARWPMHVEKPEYAGEVARRYGFDDGLGQVGFISSVTQPFCGNCSRARLSSDGQLYTCLFAQTGTDLRGPLRAGADDEELLRIMRDIWTSREDRYSEQRAVLRRRSTGQKIEMNYIGG
jgi:cyclic pyranopterin phosphate synthase